MGTQVWGKAAHGDYDHPGRRHLVGRILDTWEDRQLGEALCGIPVNVLQDGPGSGGIHPRCPECEELARAGEVKPLEVYSKFEPTPRDRDGDPLTWTDEEVEEAREHLDRLKGKWRGILSTLADLQDDLLAFREHRLWKRLGYNGYIQFVQAEFQVSKSELYRILKAGEIQSQLLQTSPIGDTLLSSNVASANKAQLRELEPLTPEQRVEVVSRIDFATTPAREIRQLVMQMRNGHQPGIEAGASDIDTEHVTEHVCIADPNAWDYCPHCGERLRP